MRNMKNILVAMTNPDIDIPKVYNTLVSGEQIMPFHFLPPKTTEKFLSVFFFFSWGCDIMERLAVRNFHSHQLEKSPYIFCLFVYDTLFPSTPKSVSNINDRRVRMSKSERKITLPVRPELEPDISMKLSN